MPSLTTFWKVANTFPPLSVTNDASEVVIHCCASQQIKRAYKYMARGNLHLSTLYTHEDSQTKKRFVAEEEGKKEEEREMEKQRMEEHEKEYSKLELKFN